MVTHLQCKRTLGTCLLWASSKKITHSHRAIASCRPTYLKVITIRWGEDYALPEGAAPPPLFPTECEFWSTWEFVPFICSLLQITDFICKFQELWFGIRSLRKSLFICKDVFVCKTLIKSLIGSISFWTFCLSTYLSWENWHVYQIKLNNYTVEQTNKTGVSGGATALLAIGLSWICLT